MEWINETPKEPKMCRLSAAVLACLLCGLSGRLNMWRQSNEN